MKRLALFSALIALAAVTVIGCSTTKPATGNTGRKDSMTQIEKAKALIGTFATGDSCKKAQ